MSRRWIFPAVLCVLVFSASLVHVTPGTVGVLRGMAGGKMFLLEPGLHLRLPFLQQMTLFPSGPFQFDFEKEFLFREGSDVPLSVHFDGALLREGILEVAGRAGARNAPTVVADDIEALLRSWTADHSASEVSEAPLEMKERFSGAARANGFRIKSLTIRRSGTAAASSATEVKPSNGVKVVLVGIDGADWQIIDPLIAAGKLPSFAKLKKTGAWASLRSMDPMLSPLLWTTVATGKPPEEHGVVDFLVPEPGTGRRTPVTSASRKVRALWNVFSEAGRTCGVVAWWATWPAERVKGTLVSDRVAYSLFGSGGHAALPGATFPESYADTVSRLRVGEEQITEIDLRPFVTVTRADLEEARKRAKSDPALAARDPVLHLTRILAAGRTYHALALDILARGQPDFYAVYYQEIDEVSHRFAHFADPKMEMVSEADHRRFRNAIEAVYRDQDRKLGEILARVDPASLVLVLSDHGFRNGTGRPRDQPPDLEGQPARWHRPYGIFLASGPMVAPGEKDPAKLLDIAPIVLEAGGLPAAADMPGGVPESLFSPSFRASRPLGRLATYETGERSPSAAASPENPEARRAAAALEENLRSLGYIGGGTAGKAGKEASPAPESAFSHANLAGIHLQKGKLQEAEREAKKALALAPGYLPALVYLAETYERQKRFAEALPLARQAVQSDSPDRQSGLYLLIANLYVALGKPKEGLADLGGFPVRRGDEADLHSAMGILKKASGDTAGAEAEYRRALAADPTAQEPIPRLFDLGATPARMLELETSLRAALQKNADSAFHHNWLGLVYDRMGRNAEAEREYRAALRSDPEHVGALVNLGNLLARQRKLDEAGPLMRRALGRDPRSLEARVALGSVLGIQGKSDEAIRTLEEGLALGLSAPSLYNALAMAYFQKSDRPKAAAALKESLRLDPDQQSARAMLRDVEKP
jgi:tetratricopeptide (TPR) repeat protein